MGLSSTVSAAFVSMLLLTGMAYVVTLNINMMRNTVEPIEEYMAREDNRLGEACTIDSWNIWSIYEIKINITNTGENGVRLSDFGEIDVILTYNTSSGIVVDWIPFDQDASSPSYWMVTDVYTNGQQGEYLNPISLGSGYGIWDPGETLQILVYTENAVTGYLYIKVTLPYGTTTGISMV